MFEVAPWHGASGLGTCSRKMLAAEHVKEGRARLGMDDLLGSCKARLDTKR